MNKLNEALRFAEERHRGQVDKAGKPYIFHLCRVADRLTTEHEKIVALLHDVIEDTDTSPLEISDLFGRPVANAVYILTRLPHVDIDDYYARIAQHTDTFNVKQADIADNYNKERLKLLPDWQQNRLHMKYAYALDMLNKYRKRLEGS